MKNYAKLRALLALSACLIVLPGCTHLFLSFDGQKNQNVGNDSTAVSSPPESLLRSLRDNPDYGLIPYGNQQVLFRDLTKPHPSAGKGKTPARDQTVAGYTTQYGERWVSEGFGVVARNNVDEPMFVFEAGASKGRQKRDWNLSAIPVSRGDGLADPEKRSNLPALEQAENNESSMGCNGRSGGHVRPHDESWLAGRDGSNWTIQVVSNRDATEPCIDRFLQSIQAPAAHRHVVYFDNALWNVAVVGEYATAEAALEAAKKFDKPWVRQIGDFRRKRCNSVQHMQEHLQASLNQWCR